MRQLKVFFAGKIDPSSKYVSPFWRDEMVWEINKNISKYRVVDSTLIQQSNNFVFSNKNLSVSTLFSQSCFYIKQSDLLVVNLTDDISVGGSQEIIIAKQFDIPVVGIAKRGGKFNRLRYELGGKTYWNWVHPFVAGLCDIVVQDIDELAGAIEDFEMIPNSGLESVTDAVNLYQRNASALDTTINHILSYSGKSSDLKQKIRVYFAGKMGETEGFSQTTWRNTFSAIISQKSRFRSVNLDFLEVSHDTINENDGRLIFGRDAYLIRTADVVVVNLSDDISIGGSIEMMLAKLYHRPLIGVARREGKFVSTDRSVFGRRVNNYINPFVSATCDWLVHEPEELPQVIDELFVGRVKTNHIIPSSSEWYKQHTLPADKVAQTLFALS